MDPAAIAEGTRFKEDLEADSLDLVELVVELEDNYGIRIPDEEAAGSSRSARRRTSSPPMPERRVLRGTLADLLDALPEDLRARRSRTPRGSSTAPSPTSAWPSWVTSS